MGLGELVNLSSSETSGDWSAAVEFSSAHSLRGTRLKGELILLLSGFLI